MTEPAWRSGSLNDIGIDGTGFDDLLEYWSNAATNMSTMLEATKTALTAANALLIDGVNPLLLALVYILDQILLIIQNIKDAKLYLLIMYPQEKTNTRFIKYQEVIPGWNSNDFTGFYTLDTKTALEKLVDSFDDEGDPNKPPTADNHLAGGFVMFAGIGEKDLIKTGGSLVSIFTTLQTLLQLFRKLVYYDELLKYELTVTNIIADINAAYAAASQQTEIDTTKKEKPTAPNWSTQNLMNAFPALGDALNGVENLFQGFKDSVQGASSAMDSLISFIDSKIEEIATLQAQTDRLLQDMKDLATLAGNLGTFNIHSIYVEPGIGGIQKLKKALADESLINRPDSDLQFSLTIAMVGSGAGFQMIASILGRADRITAASYLGTDDNVVMQEQIAASKALITNL